MKKKTQWTKLIRAGFAFCCMTSSAQGAMVLTDGITSSSIEVNGTFGGLGKELAFDGDNATYWNSNTWLGWIEVDLGTNYLVSELDLRLLQTPVGLANFDIWVSESPMLGTLGGGTLAESFSHTGTLGVSLGNPISVSFTPVAGRFVQLRTTSSPSWMAVSELDVLGSPIPEPSSAMLLLIGSASMLRRKR